MDAVFLRVKERFVELARPANSTSPVTLTPADRRRGLLTAQSILSAWRLCGWRIRARNISAVELLAVTALRVAKRPNMVLQDLKASCNAARWQSLRGTHIGRNTKGKLYPRSITPSRVQLFQLSCISRSLPEPTEEVCNSKVTEWIPTMVTPPKVLPWQGVAFIEFLLSTPSILGIASKFRRSYQALPETCISPFGGNACLGFSRKEGGRGAAFAQAKALPAPSKDPLPFGETQPSLPRGRREAYGPLNMHPPRLFATWKRQKCAQYLRDTRAEPLVQVAPLGVAERGWKVRVVTKNDPRRIAQAHTVRSVLHPLVTKNRQSVDSPPDRIPIPKEYRDAGHLVFSMDLKAATDTIRHDVLDRLCDLLKIDPDLVHTGFCIDQKLVLVGAFMGMPASWSFLDWLHHAVCVLIDPLRAFRHKGDDLIAFWNWRQFHKYSKFMKWLGFKLNKSKTFFSEAEGTFCEALYHRVDNELVRIPTMSVRVFTPTGNVDRVEQMSSATRLSFERGFSMTRTNAVVELQFSRELKLLRKRHIPVFLPRQLGGAGLVPPDPSRELTLYECQWYWAVLEKDMPATTVPESSGRPGPWYRTVVKAYRQVKWRSGLRDEDVCPHLDHQLATNLVRALCYDAEQASKRERKEISRTSLAFSLLSNYKKKVRLVSSPSATDWKTTYKVDLQPTRKSGQSFVRHQCDGRKQSKR